MDWTVIGTGIAIIGLNYTVMRNFKKDIQKDIGKIHTKLEKIDEKFERIEGRLSRIEGYLEGREFWKPENIKKTGTK